MHLYHNGHLCLITVEADSIAYQLCRMKIRSTYVFAFKNLIDTICKLQVAVYINIYDFDIFFFFLLPLIIFVYIYSRQTNIHKLNTSYNISIQ